VYEYSKPASGWSGSRTQDEKVKASDGSPGDSFGLAVAISGNVGVAGARNDGTNDPKPGAAYVLDVTPDTTAPVITLAPAPSDQVAATGWYNRASSGADGVEVEVSASDPSGVTNVTCTDGSTTVLNTSTGSGSLVLHGGKHSVACTAQDARGNVGAGPGSTTMPLALDVDETPPTIAPAVSPNPVLLHGTATVAANASDSQPGSGLDASSVACGSLDTTSIGTRTVTCTASDVAGNSAQATVSYVVQYRFLGFRVPAANSAWKAGSAITVKFGLGDVDGVAISDPEALTIGCRATVMLLDRPDPLAGAIVAGPVCATYDAKANSFVAKLVTPKTLSAAAYTLAAEVVDAEENFNASGLEPITIKR